MVHRQETITVMKKFNARRKLKAAVHTALLVTKKSSLFSKKEIHTQHWGGVGEIDRKTKGKAKELLCPYLQWLHERSLNQWSLCRRKNLVSP